MLTIRSAKDRLHDRHGEHEAWVTFYPRNGKDQLAAGFGTLEFLDEDRLPPGASVESRASLDAEVITFVREGALAFEDSMGRSGIIQAGEFQCMTATRALRHTETNPSLTDWAHVFRIWLHPAEGSPRAGYEQKRFSAAERRGGLRLIASPDARGGSLRIKQDALIYSALLEPGQHVVHELSQGRSAWLQVLHGAVILDEKILTAGDGAGVAVERAVSITAREKASILLVDVGEWLSGHAQPSGTDIFKLLLDALTDVVGTTATATMVGRAARRALPHTPELGELSIARVAREYRYVVPRSFARTEGLPASLSELLGQLKPLLVELTGQVVLRRLGQVPELRDWATSSS
jgi:redox-sensitive bicupin YhaK (pirin superfamily)